LPIFAILMEMVKYVQILLVVDVQLLVQVRLIAA
jgi:hypothetical protein